MKITAFLTRAASAAVLSGSLAGGVVGAEVDGPEASWRIATMGKSHAETTRIETIKSYVVEKTGGKVLIELGYGTFGDSRDFPDLLKIGAIHGATVTVIEIPDADMEKPRRLGAQPIWDNWLADQADDSDAASLLI